MNRFVSIFCVGIVVSLAACKPHSPVAVATARVTNGPARVWTTYDGQLEARVARDVMSNLGGAAAIVEMAPEGTMVKPGDLLVRLDSSQYDRELLRLQRDYTTAVSDLSSLTNAKLPLELRDLEMRLLTAKGELASEQQYLDDNRDLVKEGLVSELEIKKQEAKVAAARTHVENFEQQFKLTRDQLHPAAVDAAKAKLESAEQELKLGKEQVAQCVIRAPAAGYVVYKPVHVGGEFRTVHVGDTVFKNQPFMALPDLGDLVVHIDVPEAELALVRAGMSVLVEPAAYPNMRFDGVVASVGSMAENKADRPAWQKFFRVVIGLKQSSPELRTGMSVVAQVLSLDEADAVLIPRLAVLWSEGRPYCYAKRGARTEQQPLKLGAATEQFFTVADGVKSGEEVLLP